VGKTHLLLLLLFVTSLLKADVLKENFITFDINQTNPTLLLDFESDNLEKFITLDDSGNDIISWRELKAHQEEIKSYVLEHIQIKSDGEVCHKKITDFEVYRRVHQSYIKLPMTLDCKSPKRAITLDYDLFFDVDKDQKAFVKLSPKDKPQIMSARTPQLHLTRTQHSLYESFKEFVIEGIWHIWIGFDHILFLLMLIVPSVYHLSQKGHLPREKFSDVLKEILKITTAFTLAHSITLALSITNIITLNVTFVEVAIALSVLFTALNNIFTFTTKSTWMIAFAFGLIHGFGFANVLHELIDKKEGFAAMLVGFNLGVEIGQLAIVMALLPLLFFLRKSNFYQKFIMIGFSSLTAIIALLWAIERAFNLSILPW
jgi:hypothetical protein